jgi:hypothetical protein
MILTTCLVAAALAWSCQEQGTGGGEDTAPVATETAEPAAPEPAPGTPEAKIAEAESAAPPDIASNATIMDWPMEEGAEPVQLRAGTNGWTCFPSTPNPTGAVGQDPMCLDGEFIKWAQAWMGKTDPDVSSVGIGYMLQGDRGASNTDPFATEQTPDNEWVQAGPHLMVITPDPAQLAAIPTDPATGGPWVMWSGTPYAHVMVPVEEKAE